MFFVMLNLSQRGEPSGLWTTWTPVSEANVAIGVTGALRGTLLYSFPRSMALEMVRIMSGMEMSKLDAFVTSALSEVANIISGNALTYLAQNSLLCDISPPQVFVGENGTLTMTTEKAIVLPLITEIGTLEISISLHG